MPRIRTIKPDFFSSEQVAGLSHGARLLFIGLWLLADCRGRLKWVPRKFQVLLFPYEPTLNIAALAEELVSSGLVLVYDTPAQGRCGWIPTFLIHQRPHPKEAPSMIPAHPREGHPSVSRQSAVKLRDASRMLPVESRGKGKEGVREGVRTNDLDPVREVQISRSRSDLAKPQTSTNSTPSDGAITVWNGIKNELHLQPHNQAWLDACRVLGLQGHTLVIDAGTPARARWLTQHYHRRLTETAQALDPPLRVRISVGGRKASRP